MIRIKDLRVDYDNVCAVRDLSLDVGQGQVCGLIGPNGAGKTSTMRAMVGLLEPTYGDVEVAGIDVREHPREANNVVGFMPDFPPLYDDLKCWEFLDLFAASYFIPKAKRPDVVKRHLEMVGLREKADAMGAELSRGMRQRLMLAKTLLSEPKVLILDEPASGVDPQGRIDLKNIIKALAAEGKTILFSSHILAEMTEFCTAVAIMEKGKLIVGGTIEEVRARVMGGTILEVEVLGPADDLFRIVREDSLAGLVEPRDGVFTFSYGGGPEQASELLEKLVLGGVRVAAFARRKEGLEELFLKVGAKELS